MVTFWLLIDTIAMIGSPGTRGAAPSVVCSGRTWRGGASAGGAAVSAVRAAVAASVTIAGRAHRRTTSVDWALVHRLVMPCPVSGRIASKQTPRTGGFFVLRPVVNRHFHVIRLTSCGLFVRCMSLVLAPLRHHDVIGPALLTRAEAIMRRR